MKKIMFNDKYGLTKAVLEGRKTMTRLVVPEKLLEAYYDYDDYVNAVAPRDIPCSREYEKEFFLRRSPFKAGDVVKVAQCLRDMGYDPRSRNWGRGEIWGLDHTPAWANKMFVRAEDCIHEILITNVRVERLQNISDEDCIREGLCWTPGGFYVKYEPDTHSRIWLRGMTHRSAFEELIDKVSGRGTWKNNPWVFVYEFELFK